MLQKSYKTRTNIDEKRRQGTVVDYGLQFGESDVSDDIKMSFTQSPNYKAFGTKMHLMSCCIKTIGYI